MTFVNLFPAIRPDLASVSGARIGVVVVRLGAVASAP
jgi:hypothetical protein